MIKQRYSIRPWSVGKTWPSEKYMFRKGKSAIEGDAKESWSEIKTKGELNKRRLGWRFAWSGSTEKKEASHLLEVRGRH